MAHHDNAQSQIADARNYAMAWIACTQGVNNENPINPNTGARLTNGSKIYNDCEKRYVEALSRLGGVAPAVDYNVLAGSKYSYPGKAKQAKEPKTKTVKPTDDAKPVEKKVTTPKPAKTPKTSSATNGAVTHSATTDGAVANGTTNGAVITPVSEPKKKRTVTTTPHKVNMNQPFECKPPSSLLIQQTNGCNGSSKLTADEQNWLNVWTSSNHAVNPTTNKTIKHGGPKWNECNAYAESLLSRS